MRKKKFSKERFYRRLEAQNKKAVSKSETDWDVMQGGYPDFCSNIEAYLLRKPLYSKRRGRGGFTGNVNLNDMDPLLPGERLIPKELAEKLGANKPFFNTPNSVKQPEPKPEFVPPPPLEKIGESEPNNDSGLFGQCLLHMAAIVA